MSTTTFLIITKLDVGQAQKEATINEGLDKLDSAVAGQLSLSVAGSSNVTLTNTQGLNFFYVFTGVLTGNIEVRWPASGGSARNLRVYNATTGAFTLTLKVAGGSGVAITQGEIRDYVIDGSTVRPTNVTAGTYTQSSAQAIHARAFHNANQSIVTATQTAVALNSERFDTDTIHDNVTNNSRLTCKTAGSYLIAGTLSYANNTTGRRQCAIRLNGTTFIAGITVTAATGASETLLTCSTLYNLAVNDYVELMAFQDSGAGLNVTTAANYTPEFMMVRLGGS